MSVHAGLRLSGLYRIFPHTVFVSTSAYVVAAELSYLGFNWEDNSIAVQP